MKRLENMTKYILISIGVLLFLLMADILVLAKIGIDESLSNVSARHVAGELEECVDETGALQYSITQEGQRYIDAHQGFAFLMNEAGDVVWEHQMPDELPRHFTITDAIRFSRYYLMDYPVYTYIMENGVVVLGTPKGTTWKYVLTFQVKTMNTYVRVFPVMLLVNLLLLTVVPFLLVKRDQRRREKERTTWIAGVSHDIRTPLSLVLGYADEILHLTQEGMEGVGDASKAVSRRAQAIEEQAVRMKTLVINLNTENKLSFGMGSWKKEKLLLPAVIRDTICEILNRNMDEKYDIRVSISENLEQLYVKGDKELIKRLLENLINNAINHNPQGCEIAVALNKCRSPFLKKYILELSDNGCGVSREQLRRFHTVIKSDKLPEHGLGIRLVRQIAAFHHWRVRFYNNKNGGFCCRIQL